MPACRCHQPIPFQSIWAATITQDRHKESRSRFGSYPRGAALEPWVAPSKNAYGDRSSDERVDVASGKVNDGTRRRGKADQQVAGSRRDLHRDVHRKVHGGNLQHSGPDTEQAADDPGQVHEPKARAPVWRRRKAPPSLRHGRNRPNQVPAGPPESSSVRTPPWMVTAAHRRRLRCSITGARGASRASPTGSSAPPGARGRSIWKPERRGRARKGRTGAWRRKRRDSNAPVTAPSVVATARKVATRRFVMLSGTFLAAPADEVAATATIEVPTASLMSRWKTSVSTGTTTKPPPSPSREPTTPATTETPKNTSDNSSDVHERIYISTDNHN